MSARSRATALVAVLATFALPAFTALPEDPAGSQDGCVDATVGDAAAALLGAGAEVVDVGADSALVLTPGVHPGVRNRLVATDGAWCTASALNLTGLVDTELDADPVAAASTVARYLAAPFFDDVTVLDAAETAHGLVELTTHARTNGVVARWAVEVDALGVRAATWTATEFAVEPFEPQLEGLTALPGATWSYVRTPAGQLEPTTTLEELAARNDDDPSAFTSVETKDGFTIHIQESDALYMAQWCHVVCGVELPRAHNGLGPNAGQDTGVTQVDFLRIMAEAVRVNADDFYDWGWRKGWMDDEGGLYVDGAFGQLCLACVWESEHFNIHISRAVLEALDALGYSYPDERLALINVVGHEMVHNYQNAYAKPQSVGGGSHNSYSEGMARLAETLHDYSHISHQSRSLLYADDTNGCNGWQGSDADAAFAAGPLTEHSYAACYFWMTVYATHGIEGFLEMLKASEGLPGEPYWEIRPWQIYAPGIEEATGVPLAETLANFAAMSLTGRGYVWGNPTNPETEQLDWGQFLDRWSPNASASVGDTVTRTLNDGGMAAWRLEGRTATVDVSDDDGHAAALVVDDGSSTSYRVLGDGDLIEVGPGDMGWVVLMNTGTTEGEVTLTLGPTT